MLDGAVGLTGRTASLSSATSSASGGSSANSGVDEACVCSDELSRRRTWHEQLASLEPAHVHHPTSTALDSSTISSTFDSAATRVGSVTARAS